MKFTIEDMFRNSFVMTTRDDLYELFKVRFTRNGWPEDLVPKKFIGTYPKPIMKGKENIQLCTLSHYCLVNMAKTIDLPWITIFEDDALPIRNGFGILKRFMLENELPDDADMVVWGNLEFISNSEPFLYNPHKKPYGLLREDIWGAQSYTIFKKNYDTWLDAMRFWDADTLAADWYSILSERCYLPIQSFFIQHKASVQHSEYLVDKENLILFI